MFLCFLFRKSYVLTSMVYSVKVHQSSLISWHACYKNIAAWTVMQLRSCVACRYHRDHGEHHHSVSRLQRPGVRHVGAAWPALLPDPTHGARRPARRLLEAARLRRLGSPPGPELCQSRLPDTKKLTCFVAPSEHCLFCALQMHSLLLLLLLLLGRVAVCTAKAAYSYRSFPRTMCWCVCPVHCGKTADWIRMPFGMVGRTSQG